MQDSRAQNSALFIATIVATGSIAVNAAIPGAPDIEAALDLLPGDAARIIAVFVIGYAIGHVAVGLFGSAMPQKMLLLGGLAGFAICSVLIAFAMDETTFAWLRGLQGVFASVCPVIGRALVRQIGATRQAAKRMSGASAIFTWAPVVAPLLAAGIADEFSWRGVYVALAAYAGIGALWVLVADQHQFAAPDTGGGIRHHFRSWVEIGRHPVGRAGLCAGSLAFTAFFSFLAVAPNFYPDWQTAPFSLATIITLYSGGYAVGAVFSRVALNYVDETRVLFASLVIMLLAGLVQGLAVLISEDVFVQIGGAIACAVAAGAAMPNATMLALRPAASLAPLSLALLGMAKMSFAAIVTAGAGSATMHAGAFVSLVVLGCSIVSLVVVLPIKHLQHQSTH